MPGIIWIAIIGVLAGIIGPLSATGCEQSPRLLSDDGDRDRWGFRRYVHRPEHWMVSA